MRSLRRFARAIAVTAALLIAVLVLFATVKERPQDLPWTPLDLAQPVGMFTGRKLAGLTQDFPKCRALLDRAGVRYTAMPTVSAGQCGYADGVRFATGGAQRIDYVPAVTTSCPVAAALAVWEWNIVQPAAQRYLGQSIRRIDHFGSYSCRHLYGRDSGALSEHATADAIDIAGFTLQDGTRVTVLGDWAGDGGAPGSDRATFLRTVRNGACALFATTLSPDYNAAHRDHLHLDHAKRGKMGYRVCN